MSITIRPARLDDVPQILTLVNRFAAQNIMLPRKEESIRQTLSDWLVAMDQALQPGASTLVGCGALVPLTDKLVEIRSLAIHESQQGKGVGSDLVLRLVEMAREQEYEQVCALTLREKFFTRLGFQVVDRWKISPKVWQACIYCSKFHRCDEIAVLMDLTGREADEEHEIVKNAGWNSLLKWDEWQGLKLAYRGEEMQEMKMKDEKINAGMRREKEFAHL